jgi:hypothetical protein
MSKMSYGKLKYTDAFAHLVKYFGLINITGEKGRLITLFL